MKTFAIGLAVPSLLFCVHCGSTLASDPDALDAGHGREAESESSRDAASDVVSPSLDASGDDVSLSVDAASGDVSTSVADAPVDTAQEAAEVSDASAIACGAATCDAGQVCVGSARGGLVGPGVPCVARNDAGVCKAGTQFTTTCSNYMPGGGCVPGSQSACVDVPSSCSNYCDCPPICDVDAAFISCTASGRNVTCSSNAP